MADWGIKQLPVGIKMELWKIKNSEFRERDGLPRPKGLAVVNVK